MKPMSVTLDVFQVAVFGSALVASLNIPLMPVTLEVSQLDTSGFALVAP